MRYTPARALELIAAVPWHVDEYLRIFWLRLSEESREEFATAIETVRGPEAVVPLVLREPGFFSANTVLSDVNRTFESNRGKLERFKSLELARVTVALLAKEDFRLPQTSSPIVLPTWFPVLGGAESRFRISDLGQQAEVALLSAPESRVEDVSSLLYGLEQSVVDRLTQLDAILPSEVTLFAATLQGTSEKAIDKAAALSGYKTHLATVLEARAYRPSAQPSPSLVSRILRLTLNSSPKELANHAKALARAIGDQGVSTLKPTLFAVMHRPAAPLEPAQANWHAMMLAIYQAYQLMNGSAHAGEYAPYPIALLYSTSLDLRRFLSDATLHVRGMSVP